MWLGVFVYPNGSLCSLKIREILQANNDTTVDETTHLAVPKCEVLVCVQENACEVRLNLLNRILNNNTIISIDNQKYLGTVCMNPHSHRA